MTRLFQDELSYLRETGREFARLNPRLAKYLSESSTDPDVERLLEGFAFLTGRVREKIEDELPELTHSLIQLLWPNFLRPFPPTCLVRFRPIAGAIVERQTIPAGTRLRSRAIEGVNLSFRTSCACDMFPFEIQDVTHQRSQDRSRLMISFSMLSDRSLNVIGLDALRLWFTGEPVVAQTLTLWSLRYLRKVTLEDNAGARFVIPSSAVTGGGLTSEESVLPNSMAAFDPYRLLQEFFVFPDKFCCVDIGGLGEAARQMSAASFSIEFEFERALPADVRVRPGNVALHCAPAVNLFDHDADPIRLDHRKTQYRIRPRGSDLEDAEIFSIDKMVSRYADEGSRALVAERVYEPFESFRHEVEVASRREHVYFRERLTPAASGLGFERAVSFVLHDGRTTLPQDETLSTQLTCFNRDLPSELGVGDICLPTDSSPSFAEFGNVTRPTKTVYPPIDGALNWNLISNLSINYMSILDKEALKAILRIYDYQSLSDLQAERAAQLRLDGVVDLRTRPVDVLFKGRPIRGVRSTLTLDESCFQSVGELYLFGCVLREFFTLCASVNSFHELRIVGARNNETYSWPARIGRQPSI
jgi:type VI secretion system protein ImpG